MKDCYKKVLKITGLEVCQGGFKPLIYTIEVKGKFENLTKLRNQLNYILFFLDELS